MVEFIALTFIGIGVITEVVLPVVTAGILLLQGLV